MSAHTPGPHHAGHQTFKNEREKGDKHFAIFDANSACLAHVFREGDAVLYAAAPDLLAACLELIPLAVARQRKDAPYEALARARAAIAKARGQ